MKIGKPSVLQTVLIVVILLISSPFIAYGVISYVKFSFDFDTVYARDVFDFGADRIGTLDVYANGKVRNRKFGRSRQITAPYRIRVCASNAIRQELTLKTAKLTHVVEGQFMPVDAEFDINGRWLKDNPRVDRFCVNDILVLDVEVESQEIYCIDLTFDLREEEKVQRACLRLARSVGTFRATILDVLGTI